VTFARVRRVIGRISVRLLLVNAVVVLVPVAGLEFARIYERQLLVSLERDMKNQAALVRASLEAALGEGTGLSDERHVRALRNAARTTRTRIRILDPEGLVVADSHADGPPEGPEPKPPSLLPVSRSDVRSAVTRSSGPAWADVAERVEVRSALEGHPAARTRIRDRHPEVMLFLAEPIRRGGGVRGVVYVTRSTQPVMVELYRIRAGLTQVLVVTLVATALITLLLAWSISRPLTRLSEAAKRIAKGERDVEVPIGGSGEIRELGESFASMRERLDARLRYISEFSADVAHEFKSPLTSIRGAAELLSEGALDDPEARDRFLRNIELDVDRLDRLVSRLLELSRIEASSDVMAPVDIRELAQRVVERAEEPTKPVVLTYESEARIAMAREADLDTALSNLVENALRFSPDGEPVEVSVAHDAGLFVISVRDHGPGISPKVLPRVFDRFFTTDSEHSGTGLGLAIVRSVAQAHGGRVDVSSEPGHGAVFRLTIPARAERRGQTL